MPVRPTNSGRHARSQKKTDARHKKPLIRRIKFGRLLLVLTAFVILAYGAFVALSALYDWGYVKVKEGLPEKHSGTAAQH